MKRLLSLSLIGLFAFVASKANAKLKVNQEGQLNNATNSSAHYKVVDYNFGVKNDSLILPWVNKIPTVKPVQPEKKPDIAINANGTKK